jgi:Spy/CpxP family protein refolding chaperone
MTTAALAAALIAAPALAQTPPPPAGDTPGGMQHGMHQGAHQGMRGGGMGGGHMRMWAGMSPEGQAVMRDARKGMADDSGRQKLRDARDRIGTILSADKLDVAALRRAMDDERKLADAQQAARQEAMLAAFQKLSAADRKAFVVNARTGRDRMEQRMQRMRMQAPPQE